MAGFQWTISGGNTDMISSAKKRIGNGVIGLVIALGSYTLLFAINPELVNFRSLKVDFVSTRDVVFEPDLGLTNDDVTDATLFVGEDIPGLTRLPTSPSIIYTKRVSYPFARTAVARQFEVAVKQFVEKYPTRKVMVNDAYRKAKNQYAIMRNKCGCPAETSLPKPTMTVAEINAMCPTPCSAGKTIRRENGVLLAPDVSHTGANALDLQVQESGKAIPRGIRCSDSFDENIKKSDEVQLSPSDGWGKGHCIPVKRRS